MTDPIIPDLDRELLVELEPEAGRLYDRHVKVAQEWFPHDYIPYRLGPRLRQGALDAGPAAPDGRRADRVRDRPPHRGQPALATTGSSTGCSARATARGSTGWAAGRPRRAATRSCCATT